MDGTKVGFAYQLQMVSLAYRHRAIPLGWIWVEQTCGYSSAHMHVELLTYISSLLPVWIVVLLVGDREFRAVEVLAQSDQWG